MILLLCCCFATSAFSFLPANDPTQEPIIEYALDEDSQIKLTFARLIKLADSFPSRQATMRYYLACKDLRRAHSVLQVILPNVHLEGLYSIAYGMRKDNFRIYRKNAYDGPDYWRKQASLQIKYPITGKITNMIDTQSALYDVFLGAVTDFFERVSCRCKIFNLLFSIQSEQELVEAYRNASETYKLILDLLEEKFKFGEIQNESTQNEITISQVVARYADARAQFIESSKKLEALKRELEMILGFKFNPTFITDIDLPEITNLPSVSHLLKLDTNLVSAFIRMHKIQTENLKQSLQSKIPDISVFTNIEYTAREYEHSSNSPFDAKVGVNGSITLFNAQNSIRYFDNQKTYYEAKKHYCEQHNRASEKAIQTILVSKYSNELIKAQRLGVQENKRDLTRLRSILIQDPYDSTKLQRYADSLIRYADSVNRLNRSFSSSLESYFLIVTPVPEIVAKFKLPEPALIAKSKYSKPRQSRFTKRRKS